MINTADRARNYLPPVDRLLSLGKPASHAFTVGDAGLGFGPEHVPELLRMVGDEELHDADSGNDVVWAPVHAWRALAALGATEVVQPVLALLPRLDKELDEWVASEVPKVLGVLGQAALDPATAFLSDETRGDWAREAAARALMEVGKHHPGLRDECVARLGAQWEKFATQSPLLNGCLVGMLLDLKAKEALPVMARAFAAGHVDESVAGDYEDVEIELGLKTERQHPRKPNALSKIGEQLRAIADDHLLMGDLADEGDFAERPQPVVVAPKPGRNDTCPCGSGKKYKKCCGTR